MKSIYKPFDRSLIYLVTGAAGFIGFNLCDRLLREGCRVIGIDNMNQYYDVRLKEERISILKGRDGFDFLIGSISERMFVNEVFERYRPDIVINLAAQAGVRYSIDNPDSYIESNIIGFYNILEACRHTREKIGGEYINNPVRHLLFASSSSVYGNQKKTPFSVEDPVDQPISLYAATKKSNELMAYTYSHLYGIPTTGLRFFTVYGPLGRPDMAYFGFSEKILQGEPIKVFNNGDLYRDFTYIDDIIEGLFRMLNNPPLPHGGVCYKVYNIGNNKPERLMYFIEALESALGMKAKMEFCPMQPGDVYQTYADVTELEKDFDFRPSTTIEEGLGQFADWFLKWKGRNPL